MIFPIQIHHLMNVVIREFESMGAGDVRMFGTKLWYPQLGNVQDLDCKKDQCVQDYIWYECQQAKRGFKNYTLQDIQEDFSENGVSVNEILNWVRKRKDVSMYALDPFCKMMASHVAESGHTAMVLCFMVNNEHCYPILGDLKKFVERNKRLELGDVGMQIDWSAITEWKTPTICSQEDRYKLLDVDWEKPPGDCATSVLVDIDCLSPIMTLIMDRTKEMIVNANFTNGKRQICDKFQHPKTGQIIIAAPGWQDRKSVCEQYFLKTQLAAFRWRNQTWARIGRSIWDSTKGILRRSNYGPQLMKIYAQSTLKPMIMDIRSDQQHHIKPLVPCPREYYPRASSIDRVRCYTWILMTCEQNYARFEATDEVRETTPADFTALPPAEWYISKPFTLMNGEVTMPIDWYPTAFVKIALAKHYISTDLLTHILPASGYYDAKLFREHATEVHKAYPKFAKHIINHHIGYWGRRTEIKNLGAVTDSWPIACAMINRYKEQNVRIREVGDMKFMRTFTETPLADGFLPIWRQIIALSVLALNDMYNELMGPRSTLLGMTTDSIKIMNPLIYKTGKTPGDYQTECTGGTIYCRGPKTYSETSGWKPEQLIWRTVEKSDLSSEMSGAIVCGPPGSNKSTVLRKLAREVKSADRLVAGWTCKTAESLNAEDPYDLPYKTDGAIGAVTLDHAYPNTMSINAAIANYAAKTHIFIDEFSMLQTKYIATLWKQRLANPEQKFFIFGDSNQTPPMPDFEQPYNTLDYENSALMYYLCNGTRCELKYDSKTNRFDVPTQRQLDTLLKTGKIDARGKTLFETPVMTLCRSHGMRAKINKTAFEHFSSKQKNPLVKIGNFQWYVGMPIIAFTGNKKLKIVNSHKCEILSIAEGVVTIKTPVGESCVGFELFPKLFRHGWAETIRRWQGDKITSPYNIVETKSMSLNDIYTSIGRTTLWENVGLQATECAGKYYKVKPKFVCYEAKPLELEYFAGKIYEIKPADNSWCYIGMTVQNPETREIQHHNNATNAIMKSAMDEPDVKMNVVAEYKCTRQELARIETEHIHRAVRAGVKLYNKQKVKAPAAIKPPVVEHKMICTRFEIIDDESNKRFRLQYRDQNSKKVSKDFRYGSRKVNKDDIEKKALEFRTQLIKELGFTLGT